VKREWAFINRIDYIHCRSLDSITDWRHVIEQAFQSVSLNPHGLSKLPPRKLKPGGWLEWADVDVNYSTRCQFPNSDPYSQWANLVDDGLHRRGINPRPHGIIRARMMGAGFINIREFDCFIPLGAWPEDERQVCYLSSASISNRLSLETYRRL
jgi:hypothetical protein